MLKEKFALPGFLCAALLFTGFSVLFLSRTAEAAESAGTALERAVDAGVLRVGVPEHAAPLSYLDAHGKRQGYYIELAKRLTADLLGKAGRLELVLLNAEDGLDALRDDAADLLMGNLTVNTERAGPDERAEFAAPYLKARLGVLSGGNEPVIEIEQLGGKRLIVVKGGAAENHFAANYPGLELLACASEAEAFEALSLGLGGALAHLTPILHAWAADNPHFTVSIPAIGPEQLIVPAVKKGERDFQTWLNNEIDRLAANGFLLKAYELHLAPFCGPPANPESAIPGCMPREQ